MPLAGWGDAAYGRWFRPDWDLIFGMFGMIFPPEEGWYIVAIRARNPGGGNGSHGPWTIRRHIRIWFD